MNDAETNWLMEATINTFRINTQLANHELFSYIALGVLVAMGIMIIWNQRKIKKMLRELQEQKEQEKQENQEP